MSLATLEQLKRYMDIPVDKIDSTRDNLMNDLLTRTSARMENYCGRIFASDEYTEYRDGRGLPYIYTNQYPITTVSGIWDDADWAWADSSIVSSSNYRVSDDGHSINFHGTILESRVENVKLIYTAGYSETPVDVVQACLEETVIALKQKANPGLITGLKQEGSIQRNAVNFLPATISTLAKFRKPVVF